MKKLFLLALGALTISSAALTACGEGSQGEAPSKARIGADHAALTVNGGFSVAGGPSVDEKGRITQEQGGGQQELGGGQQELGGAAQEQGGAAQEQGGGEQEQGGAGSEFSGGHPPQFGPSGRASGQQ